MIDMRDYLYNSIVAPEVTNELHGYVDEAYGRFLATLDLIPFGTGRLLEIGANPYFLTLLIKKFRNYDISMTNYFGENAEKDHKQYIHNDKYDEMHEFAYKNINIEAELLPYPDEYFDVVLFCEVIEHLIENPIFALYNLHRVLKPNGTLILTTPNLFRYDNLKNFICDRKKSIYDPYSGYGIYGRHNREYSLFELKDTLSNTGYEIREVKTKFSNNINSFKRLLEKINLGSYILIKSQKIGDFRWYCPDYLFRSGFKHVIVDNFIKMGKNCSIHIDEGFYPLELWEDIGYVRWSMRQCRVILKPRGGETKLYLDIFSQFDDYRFSIELRQDEKIIILKEIARRGWQEMAIDIPPLTKSKIKIDIVTDKSWTPKKMGICEDVRELGVAVSNISLRGNSLTTTIIL